MNKDNNNEKINKIDVSADFVNGKMNTVVKLNCTLGSPLHKYAAAFTPVLHTLYQIAGGFPEKKKAQEVANILYAMGSMVSAVSLFLLTQSDIGLYSFFLGYDAQSLLEMIGLCDRIASDDFIQLSDDAKNEIYFAKLCAYVALERINSASLVKNYPMEVESLIAMLGCAYKDDSDSTL
jgi:hypothetical protein